MKIELSLFIAVFLGGCILGVCFLECLDLRYLLKFKKKDHLKKKKCYICASSYFISTFVEFWRCSLCGALNKGK